MHNRGILFRPQGQDLIQRLTDQGLDAHLFGDPAEPISLLEESAEELVLALAVNVAAEFVASGAWDLFQIGVANWFEHLWLKPRKLRLFMWIPKFGWFYLSGEGQDARDVVKELRPMIEQAQRKHSESSEESA